MKITLKLYALLSDYLPSGSENNRVEMEVDDACTPQTLITQFKIPQELAHLVLVNGVYVDPNDRDEFKFTDGDTLAIWPPVAGG